MRRILYAIVLILMLSGAVIHGREEPDQFTVVTWNMQSNHTDSKQESDPKVLASTIKTKFKDADLFGLSEVLDARSAEIFRKAAGDHFESILGNTGNRNRLQIVYDSKKLELISSEELVLERADGRKITHCRNPMLARFEVRESGRQFYFMVNHLIRSNPSTRQAQARALKELAKGYSIPLMAVGDYNFDWDLTEEKGNKAFEIFTTDSPFKWVKPKEVAKTHANEKYRSILDFVFVTGELKAWNATSAIYPEEYEQNDKERPIKSDHAPVMCKFEVPARL